jgi:hypothetical protein
MTAELDFSPLHRNRKKGEQIPMVIQAQSELMRLQVYMRCRFA